MALDGQGQIYSMDWKLHTMQFKVPEDNMMKEMPSQSTNKEEKKLKKQDG